MKKLEGTDLNDLNQLFNEEIKEYNGLIRDLNEESKYLREGLTEPLIKIVQSIEERIHNIKEIEKRISERVSYLLNLVAGKKEGDGLSSLYPHLPREGQVCIDRFKRDLTQLKEKVKKANERNKWFAEEYLALLSEMIEVIINPSTKNFSYGKHGKHFSSSPITLNREV